MAKRILTSSLKPGMVVVSQRTNSRVYRFSDHLDQSGDFPMKGKAIVLSEMMEVHLKKPKYSYNEMTRNYDVVGFSLVKRHIVVLAHFKHGIVMYMTFRPEYDDKWRLLEEKTKKPEEKVSECTSQSTF